MARSSEFQDTAAGTVPIHRFGYKMDDGEIFSAVQAVRGKYSVWDFHLYKPGTVLRLLILSKFLQWNSIWTNIIR